MSQPTDPRDPASYSGYATPADPAPPVPGPAPAYGAPQPSYGPPPQPSYGPPPTGEPVLVTIGDMSVTQFHVITPNGTHPLNSTSWYVTDNTTYEQSVPVWAIVVAVVFVWACLLSLLLLLVKETKTSGFVQVTVQGQGWAHVTQLPAGTAATAHAQAAYVRNLVAALPA